MTGGQAHLTLGTQSDGRAQSERRDAAAAARRGSGRQIRIVLANESELGLHAHALALLDKASGGKTVWRRL